MTRHQAQEGRARSPRACTAPRLAHRTSNGYSRHWPGRYRPPRGACRPHRSPRYSGPSPNNPRTRRAARKARERERQKRCDLCAFSAFLHGLCRSEKCSIVGASPLAAGSRCRGCAEYVPSPSRWVQWCDLGTPAPIGHSSQETRNFSDPWREILRRSPMSASPAASRRALWSTLVLAITAALTGCSSSDTPAHAANGGNGGQR